MLKSKRVISLCLVLCLVLINCASVFAHAGTITYKVSTPSGVNMRTSPSTSASIIKAIPNGTEIGVLLDNNNNIIGQNGSGYYWYKVEYAGKTGWVVSMYLTYVHNP